MKLSLNEINVKRIENFPGRPYLIFLHDSLGCIELWRHFPEKLGALTGCNVIIYDRQGYGKSCGFSYAKRECDYLEIEADILIELMQLWKISDAFLYGHSDGGTIALITAAKYPEKIKGIITEGAHILVEEISLKGIRDAVKLYENGNLKEKLKKYHGDKTDAMFRAWTDTWTSPEFRDWSCEKILPGIKCPALIIQGENDEFGTFKQVEGIVNLSGGNCQKLIVHGARHTPHKEKSDVVLKHSAEFIRRPEERRQ